MYTNQTQLANTPQKTDTKPNSPNLETEISGVKNVRKWRRTTLVTPKVEGESVNMGKRTTNSRSIMPNSKDSLKKSKQGLSSTTAATAVSKEMRQLNSFKLGLQGCFSVDCEGLPRLRRGGLCMLWKKKVKLDLVSYLTHHIMFKVWDNEEGKTWYCTWIYRCTMNREKDLTWDLLRNVKCDIQDEWFCMGDYNKIMSST